MKEFGTPKFGDSPSQSPLEARPVPWMTTRTFLWPAEKDTWVHIPDSAHWAGACPAPSPLESSAGAGLGPAAERRGSAVQVAPCQLHLLHLPLVTPL